MLVISKAVSTDHTILMHGGEIEIGTYLPDHIDARTVLFRAATGFLV
jgi:hypothetical protein